MATCLHCTTELTGRTKVCDGCKARVARPAKRGKSKPAAKRAAAKRPAMKKSKVAPVPEAPPSLGARGRALWKSLGQTAGTPAGELALEACRSADRLERLDSYLGGRDAWLDLVEQVEGSGRLEIVVDKALAEARQQQTTFKALLAELGVTAVPAKPPAEPAKSPLDQLRERREQKAAK